MTSLRLFLVYFPHYLHLLCPCRKQLKRSLLTSGCEYDLSVCLKLFFNKFPTILICGPRLCQRSFQWFTKRLYSPAKGLQCLSTTMMWASILTSCQPFSLVLWDGVPTVSVSCGKWCCCWLVSVIVVMFSSSVSPVSVYPPILYACTLRREGDAFTSHTFTCVF